MRGRGGGEGVAEVKWRAKKQMAKVQITRQHSRDKYLLITVTGTGDRGLSIILIQPEYFLSKRLLHYKIHCLLLNVHSEDATADRVAMCGQSGPNRSLHPYSAQ